MSVTKIMKGHGLGNLWLAYRPPQTYLSATGNYNLFTVAGGPAELMFFVGRVTAAVDGVVTLTVNLTGGYGLDGGAGNVNGAIGCPVYIPINTGGATLGNAQALPMLIATDNTGTCVYPGQVVIATFAGGVSCNLEFGLTYRRLSPLTRVYAN
jgi:hypothetical protein